jgi:hypothetical protein
MWYSMRLSVDLHQVKDLFLAPRAPCEVRRKGDVAQVVFWPGFQSDRLTVRASDDELFCFQV